MISTAILCIIIILSIQCFTPICLAEEMYEAFYTKCRNRRLPNIESVEGYLKSPSQCVNKCNLLYFCIGVNVRKIQECMYSCELHINDSRLISDCADGNIINETGIDCYIKRPDCFTHPGTGLIPNHDFEMGTDGWTMELFPVGGSIAITDSTSTEGHFSGVLSAEIRIETTFNLPPGVKMVEVQVDTKSNWERPGVPESYYLYCSFTMDDGIDLNNGIVPGQQNTNTWHTLTTKYSTDGVKEIRTVLCQLTSRVYGTTNKSWWDNMKLFYKYYPEGETCT